MSNAIIDNEQDNYMYGQINDTVNIPRNEYNDLLEDSKFLEALRSAGVDNWDGFDFAVEIFETFNNNNN